MLVIHEDEPGMTLKPSGICIQIYTSIVRCIETGCYSPAVRDCEVALNEKQ